jgi:hypothetical protein
MVEVLNMKPINLPHYVAVSLQSNAGVTFFKDESTVRSVSRCAVRLRYVDLVVSIEVAVEVCCYFTVFIR